MYNELLSEPAVLRSQVLTRVRAPPAPRNNIYDTFPIGTRPGYNITIVNHSYDYSLNPRPFVWIVDHYKFVDVSVGGVTFNLKM